MASHIFMIVLLVLGFGFVIFFHELGHFLAAKWVGIKVEQFAVGFGQAIVAWRKGIGFRVGTTTPEYEKRLIAAYRAEHPSAAPPEELSLDSIPPADQIALAKALGLGDTEYRLNWIPLGGYVKMLGQDDLRPNATADDPRAYNRKSIGARMVVVSAGVIMNIILAIIGFMIVFRIGFNAPPTVIGMIQPGSPAQEAGLRVGDKIIRINGSYQANFTSIALNTALLQEGRSADLTIERNGEQMDVQVTPRMGENGVLAIGVLPIHQLTGLPADEDQVDQPEMLAETQPPELLGPKPGTLLVEPGDRITAINGQPVGPNDFAVLDAALQRSPGSGVKLTIMSLDGSTHSGRIFGEFAPPFGPPSAGAAPADIAFAGLVPRTSVEGVQPASPALGKVMPGDVIEKISNGQANVVDPSADQLKQVIKSAADAGHNVDLTVIRNGKKLAITGIPPDVRLGPWYQYGAPHGIGIELGLDAKDPVISDVLPDSPAYKAGIRQASTITSIAGKPVSSFYDIQRLLGQATPGEPVAVGYTDVDGNAHPPVKLILNAQQVAQARDMLYVNDNLNSILAQRNYKEIDHNVFKAAWRGLVETRNFMLQFYLSLRRMFSGSISVSSLSGPVGIFKMGMVAAYRGIDWLLWFLAMISVNLAVVNFLPIPIVDGGLFTFLIIEKLQGKPISPRVTAITQYIGLAFLVGVFLFVTYHDILRP
ncbi:MAG TPA: site-2 protease family protein [Tepidisphaeraceae bacterium]|jgi:regulator of sigma E protease|nr:site-2 protease family protein [Tepidisphaeraceae bacterium]